MASVSLGVTIQCTLNIILSHLDNTSLCVEYHVESASPFINVAF